MSLSLLGRWSQFLLLTSLIARNSAIFYAQNEGNDFPRIGRRSSLPDRRHAAGQLTPKHGLDLADFGSVADAESLAAKLGEDYLGSGAASRRFLPTSAEDVSPSARASYGALLAGLRENDVLSSRGLTRAKRGAHRLGLARFAKAFPTRNALSSGGRPTAADERNYIARVKGIPKTGAVVPRRHEGVFRDLFRSPEATSSN